jgi:Domain of unknown function (DUF4440)
MKVTRSISALAALCASATDDAVATTDKAFVQAYEKGDMAAVKKLLDADFTWIDTDGVFYSKDEAAGSERRRGENRRA